MTDAASEHLAEVVRREGGRVLATLARTLGDLGLAEDAVQEAAVAALRTWPRTGIPTRPAAWLTVAARRKALDMLRRESARSGKEAEAVSLSGDETPPPDSVVRDDLLRLVFTCCHPALAPEAQVALALRTLGGLSTAEIARALLVPEATMGKRLTRARAKIRAAHIPYRVPADSELPDRLPAVLTVVYLIFNEGYAATGGDTLVRLDLVAEALRLARLLLELMPDEAEVRSLLALLLLTDARRSARLDDAGDLVVLADQDRRRWDRQAAEEGAGLLREAVHRTRGLAGPYQLQAHLAACHTLAPSWAATDWTAIVGFYDLLLQVAPSPVIRLNRAVAIGELHGPGRALAELDAISELHRLHLWHAARAEALVRLGRFPEAAAAYDRALACPLTEPERRLLARRVAAGAAG